MQKISDTEVELSDGSRIRLERHMVSLVNGARYLNVPVELAADTGALRVRLSQAGTWMENGQPCESEGTLNIQWLRSRISGALKALGRQFTFDR